MRICKQWVNLKTFFISGSSGLGNQDGDLAKTILTARKSIQFYTAPTAKDGKTYDFADSYKAQDAHLDDIDATSFDSRKL